MHLRAEHSEHAFSYFAADATEGLVVHSRRNFLKASFGGVAGLTLPGLLRMRSEAAAHGRSIPGRRALILLWMTGGPSHIDTWDPKPDRPIQNRGPFATVATRLPGVRICEHLPKQAARLDRMTLIRSMDCRKSNHEPNRVLQTGNREAAPRVNRKGHLYPAIGSIIAKHHGANAPGMPPYVAFYRSRSHVAFAGYVGSEYDPFPGHLASRLPVYTNVGVDTGRFTEPEMFRFAADVDFDRLHERRRLVQRFDTIRSSLDNSGIMRSMDYYEQQAMEMLTARRTRDAFDLSREPERTRARYGDHLWCRQALLARRLVEAGTAFVTIDLSYHPASGTWDTHGDNIPPYGGIRRGLGPLLPIFDHLLTTLVDDLEQRGLLDETMVIAMGEFGRTPMMGTQGSTDGRNHWPFVSSICLAGGRFRHGQVIGATERDGGHIKSRPVTPGDLAATIYHHFGVPLDTTYSDHTGRPLHIVQENGSPLRELL